MIQKLARPGSHGGNNVRGLVHFAHRKNRDFGNAGVDQFDGADGPLRILRINVHHHNFRALILQLTQNGVARPCREPDMAQYRTRQIGALHAAIEYDGLLAVFGKEGDGDSGHSLFLCVHCHATDFQRRGQMTFVIEGLPQTKRQVASGFLNQWETTL
jgi:hypothetical protein